MAASTDIVGGVAVVCTTETVGGAFPIDVEQANLVLSGFGTTHFTLVRRELSYIDIGQLKIVTSPLPANTTLSQLQQALAGIAQITINPLIAVEDGYVLSGYSGI